MPNSAKVTFSVENFITGVSEPLTSIIFVEGITLRGPEADPSTLITSWAQFVRLFGGEISASDFPTLAKIMLGRGAILRVNRVTHYDTGATTAVKAPAVNLQNVDPATIFSARPKYVGADYNNLSIVISAASNGDSTYFDMAITHANDSSLNESYPNLKVDGKLTAANLTFLDDVIKRSALMDFTYVDLSSLVGLTRPLDGTTAITGGSDGDPIVATDYVGSSADQNGFYAFDAFDDGYFITAPEISTDTVMTGGVAYAVNRKDIIFAGHIANTNTTATAITAARDAITMDTPYAALYGGGDKVLDENGDVKEVSELGAVMGAFAYSSSTYGPWWSFAGSKRGQMVGSLGVVNNFGSPGRYTDLNLIANKQINMTVVKDGVPRISGNFTGQKAYNQQSFLNVQLLLLYIQKATRPIFENYLEDPLDIQLMRQMYYHLKPFFDNLASAEARALWGYTYEGDQDATSLDTLQVNQKADVLLGKYKINLKITPIASMQELNINIMLTSEGVEFTTF